MRYTWDEIKKERQRGKDHSRRWKTSPRIQLGNLKSKRERQRFAKVLFSSIKTYSVVDIFQIKYAVTLLPSYYIWDTKVSSYFFHSCTPQQADLLHLPFYKLKHHQFYFRKDKLKIPFNYQKSNLIFGPLGSRHVVWGTVAPLPAPQNRVNKRQVAERTSLSADDNAASWNGSRNCEIQENKTIPRGTSSHLRYHALTLSLNIVHRTVMVALCSCFPHPCLEVVRNCDI